jgi:ankyrin repeat protein
MSQNQEENFIFACQFGIHEIVEKNINNESNINYVNYFGQTPLMISIISNKPQIAQMLLKQKNIIVDNKSFLEEKTCLMLACERGYSGIIQGILSKNAYILDVDVEGKTCLHYAIINKYFSVAQALIKIDADVVNIQDNQGRTALHYALNQKVVEKVIVNLLLINGAQDLKDLFDKRPSDLATPELKKELDFSFK